MHRHAIDYVLGQNRMSADADYQPTPRSTPTRYRERARYDRRTVHRILDEALICHLGYLSGGRPVVLPTTHARRGETLYLHGSTGGGPVLAARAAAAAGAGLPVCVTVTLVDALVLARAAMHHSVNFRSVVVLGDARVVDDPAEKSRALSSLLDHIAPGRAADCRAPDARELAATGVLALDLAEVSAKVRSGPPVDDPQDLLLPHWAGVVPLQLSAGPPVPAPDLDPAVPLPGYLG
ncbi:pyridoxamine 5'-phosphate oxidase family protein [Mycobacterium avium subsp. hominissuis]